MIVKIDELKCILFKKCMPHRHHLDARDIALNDVCEAYIS